MSEIPDVRPNGDEGLTFDALREANVTRCKRWHPGFLSDEAEEWTGADWSNAMCGEAGETANVVKKLRRVETGTDQGPDDPPPERLREMLADEIADTVTYADLLAAHYGIDLAQAVAAKFNRVSERQGFPDRLCPSGTLSGLREERDALREALAEILTFPNGDGYRSIEIRRIARAALVPREDERA